MKLCVRERVVCESAVCVTRKGRVWQCCTGRSRVWKAVWKSCVYRVVCTEFCMKGCVKELCDSYVSCVCVWMCVTIRVREIWVWRSRVEIWRSCICESFVSPCPGYRAFEFENSPLRCARALQQRLVNLKHNWNQAGNVLENRCYLAQSNVASQSKVVLHRDTLSLNTIVCTQSAQSYLSSVEVYSQKRMSRQFLSIRDVNANRSQRGEIATPNKIWAAKETSSLLHRGLRQAWLTACESAGVDRAVTPCNSDAEHQLRSYSFFFQKQGETWFQFQNLFRPAPETGAKQRFSIDSEAVLGIVSCSVFWRLSLKP